MSSADELRLHLAAIRRERRAPRQLKGIQPWKKT